MRTQATSMSMTANDRHCKIEQQQQQQIVQNNNALKACTTKTTTTSSTIKQKNSKDPYDKYINYNATMNMHELQRRGDVTLNQFSNIGKRAAATTPLSMMDIYARIENNCCSKRLKAPPIYSGVHGSSEGSNFEPHIPIRYTLSDQCVVCDLSAGGLGMDMAFETGSRKSSSLQTNYSGFTEHEFAAGDAGVHRFQAKMNNGLGRKQQFLLGPVALRMQDICNNALNIMTHHLRQELQAHKSTLADKLCMLQELEEKLEASEAKLQERLKLHDNACRTIQKLMYTIKQQEEKIAKLQTKQNATQINNTDKTSDLEIQLTNDETKSEVKRLENIIKQQEQVIAQLQAQTQKQTTNLQSLINNELWEKNREIERLNKLVANSSNVSSEPNGANSAELQQLFAQCDLSMPQTEQQLIEELRQEVAQAQSEAESAEKWRRECADVCTVLSNRLEELAGFLNSLLQHKDVLGALAADRRRAIRKAVDHSLDLSKSLNMTLSMSGISICEQSLVQLSNLSDILGDVDANHTLNSQEDVQNIEILRAENKELKRELEKRRHAENKRERRSLPLAALDNQSESEAWSEPDRMVSLARMGLDEQTNVCKELSSGHAATADTDSDSEVLKQQSRSSVQKVRALEQRITQLEQMVSERDERILEVQCLLVDADSSLQREKLRVLELEKLASQLPEEIAQKTQALEQLQEERERVAIEARLAELQIDVLKGEMEELHQQHAQALQHNKQEMETRLTEQQQQHAEELQQNWVARDVHEQLQQQLRQQLRQQQDTLENLLEQEEEYKQTLLSAEMSERALKKQLDENTLQASKAVMERSKALKEKLQLEQRVHELQQRLQTHEEERAELQCQISSMEKAHKTLQAKEQQGYSSEEVAKVTVHKDNIAQRGNNTSSPDLGIESDAGRFSSGIESSKPINKNAAQLNQLKDLCDGGAVENISPNEQQPQQAHDCAKVEQENAELRRKLIRTKRAFEDTYLKLRIANQKKAQIEKDIKSQILKTHNVLKNVRSNMENEQQ